MITIDLSLTEEQARLVKHILKVEADEYIREERKSELQAWLGEEEGKDTAIIIFTELDKVIEKLDGVEDTNKERCHEMEMAKIYISNIYELAKE